MPKSIFAVPVENSNFILPPMSDTDGGTQLHYDDNGVLRGGYSAIGQVAQAPSALVLIHSSEATIDTMKADDTYLWMEDVDDAIIEP